MYVPGAEDVIGSPDFFDVPTTDTSSERGTTKHRKGPQRTVREDRLEDRKESPEGLVLWLGLWFAYYLCELCLH